VRALIRVGDALAEISSYDEFNAYYKRALPIVQELREKAPGSDATLNAFGIVNDRLGRKTMNRADDLARLDGYETDAENLYKDACGYLGAALEAFQNAARIKPDEARYRQNLPQGLGNLALCLRNDAAQVSRAVELARESYALTEKQVAGDSANREARFNLIEKSYLLANVLTRAGSFAEAEKLYQKSLADADELIGEDPANVELYLIRFHAAVDYGDELSQQKKFAEALKIYADGDTEVQTIFNEKNPPFARYASGLTAMRAGDVYDAQADYAQAAKFYRHALENWLLPETRRSELSRSPEQIEALRQKLAECEKKTAEK
jgi:hypothetical protein